jgi:hypothetical protein
MAAVEFYELAFEEKNFEKNKARAVEAYFKYAESCRKSYSFNKAEKYYKKVVESGEEKSKYPTAYFYYPYTLKHLAKYDLAKAGFEQFLTIKDNSKEIETLKRQAAQEVKSCILALEIYTRPIEGVSVENVGDNVNTKYSDFAPHLVDGDLYFSSLKFEAQTQRRINPDDPAEKHLYGKLMVAKDGASKKGSLLTGLNQKYINIGNSTLSPDGKRLYYSVCDKDPVTYEFICKIFMAERSGKGKPWSKGKELPFNSKKGTNTHPNIAFDSTINKEVMYFISGREGGEGDHDVWVVTIESNGKYGEPVNLGKVINTEGKEATPFFHQATQTLYFSSTWHPGLGGYDIFKSTRENGQWTTPINVGVPLNSAANDLYFYISPQVDTFGYFSSNRPGSKILTGESCCNDIYALVLPTTIEPGLPTDIVANNDPEPEPEPEPNPNPEPEPEPIVEPNPEPEPIVEPKPEPIVEPKPEPEPIVEPKPEPEPIVEPKPEPQPEPKPEPTVNDLEKMLPLTLYFHNDEPDSNTRAIVTRTTYDQAFNSFMSLKGLYETEYSAQFKGVEEQGKAQEKVKKFFKETVQKEYDRMNEFMTQMQKILERGEALEVQVRGFCSPRATTTYNINLAQRRISCLKNQVASFNKGALKKYINNGTLRFVDLPIGEAEAPGGISDDMNDPRNSICSPEASAQRKVHIEAIKKVVN